MNFSGQYKRGRTINLGGRSAGQNSKEAVLKRAQASREERERARKQERAAVRIQAFYRSRLAVFRARLAVRKEWDDEFGESGGQSLDDGRLRRFLSGASFYMRAFFAETTQQEAYRRLEVIAAVVSATGPSRLRSVMGTRNPLADEIGLVWTAICKGSMHSAGTSGLEVSEQRQFVNMALKIALELADWMSSPGVASVGALIENEMGILVPEKRASHSKSGGEFSLGSDRELLNQVVARVASGFGHADVLHRWLSLPDVFAVIDVNAVSESVAKVLAAHEKLDTGFLATLDTRRRLWTLANVLQALGDRASESLAVVTGLNRLLSDINVTVVVVDEDSDDDNSEISVSATYYGGKDPRDARMLKSLSILYSRHFSASVFKLVGGDETSQGVDVLASLYVSLIWLWRQRKKDIMLYLSVAVDASPVHIFWNSFRATRAFAPALDHIPSATEMLAVPDLRLTWNKLILTLELFSYWLIVADDTEFRENHVQGLSPNGLREMSLFLKNLCFSLLWNWSRLLDDARLLTEGKANEKLFVKLKEICILVIRQIYIRDSRRQIFPDNFWLMTDHIDMGNFIPVVVEEQERLDAQQNEGDDSDTEEQKRPGRSVITSNRASGSVIAPRVELLRHVPFFMPFDLRVKIFQAFIERDEQINMTQASILERSPFGLPLNFGYKLKATVHRETLLDDAYNEFSNVGTSFKHPLAVQFISNGMEEAGIDGGGLTKEFLTSVVAEGFSEDKGFFSTTNDHLLYPNPVYGLSRSISQLSQEEQAHGLRYIKFLGQIIGKCLYSGILVDVEFAPFFLQKWAGRALKNSFDDLYSLDPEIYSSLVQVRRYPGDVENDLNLDFTILQDVGHGRQAEVQLKPNGSNTPVTAANRLEYIHAVANYKLNATLAAQTNAFLTGMSSLISLNWLSMFNASELQMLISGGHSKINVTDLANNTIYHGFNTNDKTIELFWSVVDSLPEEDKQKFVKFVTSVPRAPLLGFSQLNPKFAIRNAGSDCERLPTASTCVNMLKLPAYTDAKQLREKLLYAIRSGAGFDLS